MYSPAIECVLFLQNVFSPGDEVAEAALAVELELLSYRMCSLTIECVPILQNVFSPGDEVAEAALAVELELLAHYGGEG